MLINDEIQKQLLQLFAKSSNIPKVEAEQQSAAQLQLTPGQQVQAEVVSRLPNHLYLARIAGELFKMELPLNVQPGETMQMTFVGADPRITFELLKPENATLPVNISTTGKWLSSLINAPNRESRNAHQGQSARVLDGPPGDTAVLAERLQEALSLGGLFYESHLAEWAVGERSLKQLLREPQGKLSRPLQQAELTAQQPEAKDTFFKEAIGEATSPGSSSGAFAAPETLPVIKEQLATLTSGVVTWKGEVWPDQQADLSVQEREADPAFGPERGWESTVRLHLPKLGTIDASFRLYGTALTIVIEARESGTVAALNGDLPALKERLDAAGIRLTESVVAHEKR